MRYQIIITDPDTLEPITLAITFETEGEAGHYAAEVGENLHAEAAIQEAP